MLAFMQHFHDIVFSYTIQKAFASSFYAKEKKHIYQALYSFIAAYPSHCSINDHFVFNVSSAFYRLIVTYFRESQISVCLLHSHTSQSVRRTPPSLLSTQSRCHTSFFSAL